MIRSSISSSFLGIVLGTAMPAVGACSESPSSSATISVRSKPSLIFQSGNGAPPPPQISAVAGIGTVRVTGGFEGDACAPPQGGMLLQRNVLWLEVVAVLSNPPCDARVVFNYDATVVGLEPGDYTLEVYHRVDRAPARGLVHRVLITVQ